MHIANINRYNEMSYRYVGKSGLKLPIISLGMWHNFGDTDSLSTQKNIILKAFDSGITHFDLANNYGNPAGSAEKNFSTIFKHNLKNHRDEMIISSKAGYYMWEGPYGEWGSKKSIIASADQSLDRLGLDYVDIFYHHRPDPNTPLEETANALNLLVNQGKALYIGVSNYTPEQTKEISKIFRELKTPFIVHQPKYNMFNRTPEEGLFDTLKEEKVGAVVYSPLAQGLLTNRYLNGVPEDSRASKDDIPFLSEANVNNTLEVVKKLNSIANNRDQSLSQMAIAWNLRDEVVSSVIVGASRASQLEDNLKAIKNLEFSKDELDEIENILKTI